VSEQVRQQLTEKRRQLQRLQKLQRGAGRGSIRPGWRLCLLLAAASTVAGGFGGLPFLLLAAGLSAGVLLVKINCTPPHDALSNMTHTEVRQHQLQQEIAELEHRLHREAQLG